MWSNHQTDNRKGRFNTHTHTHTHTHISIIHILSLLVILKNLGAPLTGWKARLALPAYSSGDMLVIVCMCVCVCNRGIKINDPYLSDIKFYRRKQDIILIQITQNSN